MGSCSLSTDFGAWSLPLPLLDYFQHLIGSDGKNKVALAQVLGLHPGSGKNTRSSKPAEPGQSFAEVFANAKLNFTHFTSTNTALMADNRTDLLHDLLRQSAALQLSFGQPTWDILIPIYLGDAKTTFDTAAMSAILISVKNKSSPSPLIVTRGDLLFFQGSTQPVIAILLDLGVKPRKSSVSQLQHISYKNRPPCYAFRLQGAAARTFGVLSHNSLASVCARVLKEVIPVQSIDNAICQSYDRFSNHSRTHRFPG
jgi:hypothetical protein